VLASILALAGMGLVHSQGYEGAKDAVGAFLAKRRFGDEAWPARLVSSIAGSRGKVTRALVDTIQEHPWVGVGFGVAALGVQQKVETDSVTGLAISAPIEQGFLPLAVLAQVGVIGSLGLLAFSGAVFWPIFARGSLGMMCWALGALLTNFGEMTFFAIGGMGLQMWLFFGLCHEHSLRGQG